MTAANHQTTRLPHPKSGNARYAPAWNLIILLAGLIDPVYGIFIKLLGIFRRPRLPPRADTPQRRRRGLILVLGGVEGPSFYNQQMVCGLLRSRYRGAVARVDWNDGVPIWRSAVNLMSRRHQDTQARLLADSILEYQRTYPGRAVSIVAQSGGCWITLRALELLPAGARIHRAALIAPAVSPGYDTRQAVEKCAGGLMSVGAAGDYFFLGLGTLLFGTSDRVFSPSAGLVGWHYKHAGFIEARWHPAWLPLGFIGNHTTSATARFMAAVVGPWLAANINSCQH